jgi:hypothetical protein
MAGTIYVVQDGDTLAKIAESQCGDGKLADALAALNRLDDPSAIYGGVTLIIDCDALKSWKLDSQPLAPGPSPDQGHG